MTIALRRDLLATKIGRYHKRDLQEFFATIENPNTLRAYHYGIADFCRWCEDHEIVSIKDVEYNHIKAWIADRTQEQAVATVSLHLTALRRLFDWFVVKQIVDINVALLAIAQTRNKMENRAAILSPDEIRALISDIHISRLSGLRDLCLIGVMIYGFARISVALNMKVSDVYRRESKLWIRLRQRKAEWFHIPCHPNLETWLSIYLKQSKLSTKPDSPLFPSIKRGTGEFTDNPLLAANAYDMIQRHAKNAGLKVRIGTHSFRATGITRYLKNGGQLEIAANIAGHTDTKTTQLYHRQSSGVTLDMVKKINV